VVPGDPSKDPKVGRIFEELLPKKNEAFSFASDRVWPDDKKEASKVLYSWWEQNWRDKAPGRDWTSRPIPREIEGALARGWLPASGSVVDLGCGTADIAAWFAERGYWAMGIDLSDAAVKEAATRHAGLSENLKFRAMDLCSERPKRKFDILIDRGCLHQLPDNLVADYVANLAEMAKPGAKMMLFTKAFRGKSPDIRTEARQRRLWVEAAFKDHFEVKRARPTLLNRDDPKQKLPAMAYWLVRNG